MSIDGLTRTSATAPLDRPVPSPVVDLEAMVGLPRDTGASTGHEQDDDADGPSFTELAARLSSLLK